MNADEVIEHSLTGRDGVFRIIVREDHSPAASGPVCAAVFGEPTDSCLVRIQSRCLYGEIFEAEDCDCRWQLRRSLELIRQEGAGITIYLDQEGRGLGLVSKAKGYAYAQQTNADTFSSYAALDLPADSRTYDGAAAILKYLGLTCIRLLTNNPMKIDALSSAEIEVTREPLIVPVANKEARAYLMAKRQHGHLLPPPSLATETRNNSPRNLSSDSIDTTGTPPEPVSTQAVS